MAEVEPIMGKLGLPVLPLEEAGKGPDPDFVVIPGGSCQDAVAHDALAELLRRMNSEGKLIAGICNGALVVANSGILRGRECTHTAVPKYAKSPRFAELLAAAAPILDGSIYVDRDVVVAGNVITAKPWAAEEFADAVVDHLRRRR